MKKICFIIAISIWLSSCNTYVPCATYSDTNKDYTQSKITRTKHIRDIKKKQKSPAKNYYKSSKYKKHLREVKKKQKSPAKNY